MINKNTYSFKIISFILIFLLIFPCFSFSKKQAYAESVNNTQEGISYNDFIPSRIIKDDIKVGNVESVLTGIAGIKDNSHIGNGQTYYSYYELVPKEQNTYFNTGGSFDYWNADYEKLNFLKPTKANEVLDEFYQRRNSMMEELANQDFAKLKLADLISVYIGCDTSQLVACFLLCGIGIGLIWAGLAAGYVETALAGGLNPWGLIIGGVILLAFGLFKTFEWLCETDDCWSCEIEKVGFEDGEGIINIDDCEGGDDGITVLAMNNDEVIGIESAEWRKGNDKFKLDTVENDNKEKVTCKCNRIIIAGGYGCFYREKTEKTLISKMVNNWDRENIKSISFWRNKANKEINNNFISTKDFKEIKTLFNVHAFGNCDGISNEERNERVKRYIELKCLLIMSADKDIVNLNVDKNLIKFYIDSLSAINRNDYEWIHNENYKLGCQYCGVDFYFDNY